MKTGFALCLAVLALFGGATAAPRLEGAFPLMCTPYTDDAGVDYAVLADQAEFMESCGVGGIVWPSANDTLSMSDEEFEKGLDAFFERAAAKRFRAVPVAVCPGLTSADAISRAKAADRLARQHGVEIALLVRPPDDAKGDEDVERHYRSLAAEVRLPTIIQTYNGGKTPQPSVALLVRLAEDFPGVYGWVKEESPGDKVNKRIEELIAHKPAIKGVFSGWGALGWLYQGPRLGTCGVITQRPAYSDLLAFMADKIASGADASDPELADAYAKYLSMCNLGEVMTGSMHNMRGPHLYVLQQRGVLRNTLTREKAPKDDPQGRKWIARAYEPTDTEKAEIMGRFQALRKYLRHE